MQKHGAIAVIGASRKVITVVAEAEADIRPFHNRHMEKATKMQIDIQTLPKSNPLVKLRTITTRRFMSPLQRISRINRIQTIDERDNEMAIELANKAVGILIVTCTSARSGIVGIEGRIRNAQAGNNGNGISSYFIILGKGQS
ncbi:hypothetical protein TSTA_024700 [Talaromyces stipitatus ATCC 10500]|uniref:Uncharacterized protein n=1 Tax=Talaromyces stipitatus (strain ATCC 10500 / CBS 375.48 / QM 6759 / NRRL 1006) TaxID=441959 RepID=B8M4F3_TALSN|nr:uncharacterized protein TSTA_024700 [Talaromyces stipitatus ATCC 10500]EED19148.1 hypothetical protein TSTA_024700 [Talaromyces stipitatus ATCC 10500]